MMIREKYSRFLGPAIVALSGAIMLIWSWGTWPDPVVDFGRELYVPWQLSQGKILYRDIVSYFNGPLSPYLHAIIFKIFGVSLRTLVMFNLLVVAILAALLYRLIAQAAGQIAATACGIAFFVLFAFAQFLTTGNYNYVCPYSCELSHGITLSAAAIFCLSKWNRTDHRGWLIASGLLLGLVFLTKAEIFFAAAVALWVGVIANIWIKKVSARVAATFFAAMIAPIVLAVTLLIINLSFKEALGGVAGAWKWAGNKELLELPFFQNLAGTGNIGASLKTIFLWSGAYLVVFGLSALAGILMRNRGRLIVSIAVFVIWLGAGWWWWMRIDWNQFVRPMPLFLCIVAIVMAIQIYRRKSELMPLVLVVWAIAMSAKMFFNVHIYHYGFALAMPATLIGLTLLIGWIPAWIDSLGGCGWVLRAAAAATLIAVIYVHCHALEHFWSRRTFVVGNDGDRFLADHDGAVVEAAVNAMEKISPRDATLAVVPEGLMINYLSRRENPTGQLNFTPPAMIMYGEDKMLRAFEKHPPDFVMITNVDTVEYAARFFGVDYGRRLSAWIHENYSLVEKIGDNGQVPYWLGVELLKKKTK